MWLGRGNLFVRGQYFWGAEFQFPTQVFPFVKQLAAGFFEDDCFRATGDF
jgi:hypothetical protein